MNNIQYILVRNETLLSSKRCTARVLSAGTADLNAVVDLMVDRGSSLLKSEIISVLDEFQHAIEKLLLDGKTVVTPLANFRVGLHGIFENEADSYESGRHQLVAQAHAGNQLRRAIAQQAQATRTEGLVLPPNPIRYHDISTGQENLTATPGHTAWLYGYRLRVDPADPRQGIYFIAADGTAIRIEEISWNMPGRLIFINPALPAGEYRLEVRTLNYAGDEVQSGPLPDKLVVS